MLASVQRVSYAEALNPPSSFLQGVTRKTRPFPHHGGQSPVTAELGSTAKAVPSPLASATSRIADHLRADIASRIHHNVQRLHQRQAGCCALRFQVRLQLDRQVRR